MKNLLFILITALSFKVNAQQSQPIVFPIDSSLVGEYIMPKMFINRWQDTIIQGSNIYYQTTYHSYMEVKGDANAVKIIYNIETVEKIGDEYKVINTALGQLIINTKEFVINMLQNPQAATPFITGNILNPLGFQIHLNTVQTVGTPINSILAPQEAFNQFLQSIPQNP